jgi:hypothetical protein
VIETVSQNGFGKFVVIEFESNLKNLFRPQASTCHNCLLYGSVQREITGRPREAAMLQQFLITPLQIFKPLPNGRLAEHPGVRRYTDQIR